jgi:hypothetical protein
VIARESDDRHPMIPGAILSLAILAPNLGWLAFRPREAESTEDRRAPLERVLGALEIVGRVGVMAIPFFYDFAVTRPIEKAALFLLLGAIAIYYACWRRYFIRGRHVRDLYAPLGSLPVPMAIAPVIAFCTGAILLRALPLAAAAVVLGVSHIPICYRRALTRGDDRIEDAAA